jgi:hypothetical protein
MAKAARIRIARGARRIRLQAEDAYWLKRGNGKLAREEARNTRLLTERESKESTRFVGKYEKGPRDGGQSPFSYKGTPDVLFSDRYGRTISPMTRKRDLVHQMSGKSSSAMFHLKARETHRGPRSTKSVSSLRRPAR